MPVCVFAEDELWPVISDATDGLLGEEGEIEGTGTLTHTTRHSDNIGRSGGGGDESSRWRGGAHTPTLAPFTGASTGAIRSEAAGHRGVPSYVSSHYIQHSQSFVVGRVGPHDGGVSPAGYSPYYGPQGLHADGEMGGQYDDDDDGHEGEDPEEDVDVLEGDSDDGVGHGVGDDDDDGDEDMVRGGGVSAGGYEDMHGASLGMLHHTHSGWHEGGAHGGIFKSALGHRGVGDVYSGVSHLAQGPAPTGATAKASRGGAAARGRSASAGRGRRSSKSGSACLVDVEEEPTATEQAPAAPTRSGRVPKAKKVE